ETIVSFSAVRRRDFVDRLAMEIELPSSRIAITLSGGSLQVSSFIQVNDDDERSRIYARVARLNQDLSRASNVLASTVLRMSDVVESTSVRSAILKIPDMLSALSASPPPPLSLEPGIEDVVSLLTPGFGFIGLCAVSVAVVLVKRHFRPRRPRHPRSARHAEQHSIPPPEVRPPRLRFTPSRKDEKAEAVAMSLLASLPQFQYNASGPQEVPAENVDDECSLCLETYCQGEQVSA
ncbi:MAG: hypothetical protein SGPRY_001672, partial [Prymnesium sp.]